MDVSDILYIFSAREGEGGVRGAGRGAGVGFFYWKSQEVSWGSPRRGGGVPRGLEGVCGEFGRGGLNIFFRGRNSHKAGKTNSLAGHQGFLPGHPGGARKV